MRNAAPPRSIDGHPATMRASRAIIAVNIARATPSPAISAIIDKRDKICAISIPHAPSGAGRSSKERATLMIVFAQRLKRLTCHE